jgi:hypothetical protein
MCYNGLKLSTPNLNNRLSAYHVKKTNKIKENYTIKQIFNNRNYTRILNKITRKNYVQEQKEVKTKTKWPKFTYVGRQTKFITRFKNSCLKVIFKTDITIGKLLAQNNNFNQKQFNKCGVLSINMS